MFYVIHEQLLMLHLVFKPQSDKREQGIIRRSVPCLVEQLDHRFVDSISIRDCFLYRRARTSAAFILMHARTKSLVVRIEIEEILVRVNLIAGHMFLEQQ